MTFEKALGLKPAARVRSGRNPEDVYTLYKNNDGTILCECLGFSYRRYCKHVTAYKAKYPEPVEATTRAQGTTVPGYGLAGTLVSAVPSRSKGANSEAVGEVTKAANSDWPKYLPPRCTEGGNHQYLNLPGRKWCWWCHKEEELNNR